MEPVWSHVKLTCVHPKFSPAPLPPQQRSLQLRPPHNRPSTAPCSPARSLAREGLDTKDLAMHLAALQYFLTHKPHCPVRYDFLKLGVVSRAHGV